MRKALLAILACVLCTSVLLAGGKAETARPATFQQQNTAMGYLIYHLSSINAINGLNLSRAQAVQLRALAKELEASAPPVDLTAPYRPDLGEVRDTYMAVRRTLLAGEDVDEATRRKVGEARRTESLVIRLSLVHGPSNATGCAQCHAEPAASDVRTLPVATVVDQKPASLDASQHQTFMAHLTALYGREGLMKLALKASQVDNVLTTAQKEAVRNFSCCLVPPKDMNDPVRAGQADGGEAVTKLLRYVRSVSAEQWPALRTRLLDGVDGLLVALQPGAGEARKSEARASVAEIYDRTRALSDTDFELEKDTLSKRLTQATKTTKELNDRQQTFMRAMFLMVPGATAAYDGVIKRLDAAEHKSNDRQARAAG